MRFNYLVIALFSTVRNRMINHYNTLSSTDSRNGSSKNSIMTSAPRRAWPGEHYSHM